MLIGELVPEALRFLRNNPASPELSAFDHVIVDEYQDLNRAEQLLIDLVATSGSNAIIGDVDQSIYSFRHAHPVGIEEFGNDHPGTHDERLIECRRCATQIVSIADHLIRHNHPPGGVARLSPMPGNANGDVHIVQWGSIEDEAAGLADYIKWLTTGDGYGPGDVLVLTPRRLLGYQVRDELVSRDVAVHSFYHEEALEDASAQEAFTLLNLLVNNEDRVSLRWWLGCGSPSGRKSEYTRLRQHCEAAGESPWQALTRIDSGELAVPRTTRILSRFRDLRAKLATLGGLEVKGLVDELFADGDDGCANIRESALVILEEIESPSELLDRLKSAVTQPEMPEEGDFVRVMSLHKSKGLTSKVVIVAGAILGLIPFSGAHATPAEQDNVLREQRRLFYVALTRARDVLVVSSAIQMERSLGYKIGAVLPVGQGKYGATIASPFLAELGPDAPPALAGSDWQAKGWK